MCTQPLVTFFTRASPTILKSSQHLTNLGEWRIANGLNHESSHFLTDRLRILLPYDEATMTREELIEQIKFLQGSNELIWQQIREREAQIGLNIKEASRLMNLLINLKEKGGTYEGPHFP